MAQVTLEGEEYLVLLDSGSQVNTITLEYVEAQELKVFPIEELSECPVSLVGIGGMRTGPLGFVKLETCIAGVGGYREDQVFLVVPDASAFGSCVPIILGTSTIGRVINVIKESEMDELSTPWATAKLVTQLSLQKVEVKEQLWDDVATKPIDLLNLNKKLRTKEEIEPLSTWIMHRRVRLRLGHKMHVMTTALAEGEGTTPYG